MKCFFVLARKIYLYIKQHAFLMLAMWANAIIVYNYTHYTKSNLLSGRFSVSSSWIVAATSLFIISTFTVKYIIDITFKSLFALLACKPIAPEYALNHVLLFMIGLTWYVYEVCTLKTRCCSGEGLVLVQSLVACL